MVGSGSCSSSGCHGRAASADTPAWRSAATVWATRDPHRRAFEVLYAPRSVEIYLNLNPALRDSTKPLDSAEYNQFLHERCLGCHATGVRGQAETATTRSVFRPEQYLHGVSCESCHGAGQLWTDLHYLETWPALDNDQRTRMATATGFVDTANLRIRAQVCVGCHVGPRESQSTVYDVTHDLIAAGHPRLDFEFDAYLGNLPKHWDVQADRERHERVTGGAFHIDAWRFGQEQSARQTLRLWELRLAPNSANRDSPTWPDFSTFRCLDCHHALAASSGARPQAARLAGRRGTPRLRLEPLENWAAMLDATTAAELKPHLDNLRATLFTSPAPSDPGPGWNAVTTLQEWARSTPPLPTLERGAHAEHVRVVRQIVERNRSASAPAARAWTGGWESGVELLLAADSLVRELPEGAARESLEQVVTEMRRDLSEVSQFVPVGTSAGTRPTVYDSPGRFEPSRWAPVVERLEKSLDMISP